MRLLNSALALPVLTICALAAGAASGQSSGYVPGKACSIIGTCAGLTAGVAPGAGAPQSAPLVRSAYEDALSRLPPDPAGGPASQNPPPAFTPLPPGANYAGKSCVFFTRPAVEPGSDQLNLHADGAQVIYGGVHYVCQGRRWRAATVSDGPAAPALRAEVLEARQRDGRGN